MSSIVEGIPDSQLSILESYSVLQKNKSQKGY